MNYRTNEDKRCGTSLNNFNAVLHIEDLTGDDVATPEPVTPAEVKNYLRLEGFDPNDTPSDFDFDDDLIDSLITEGRQWVEKFTGVYLVKREIVVTLCNGNGLIELPGPVATAIVMTDNGQAVTDQELIGTQFPLLKTPLANELKLTYDAGYDTTVPTWAKNAILAYIADHYEYRGDDAPPAANRRAVQKCRLYRRAALWA